MTKRNEVQTKKKSRILITGLEALLLVGVMFSVFLVPNVRADVGFSDNGILVERWRFDMDWYAWGYFGASPAIADLGVNTVGSEPDSDLEIATGSDEMWGPTQDGVESRGVWRAFDSGGNLEWQRGTQTDEARSSLAIVDIDGDGDLEMAGGTTSGWYFEVMDHQGNFVWTFPKLTGSYYGAGTYYVWPSSPAVADLDSSVSGLELVIGNRWLGNVWAFDGDNSDGIDDGITIGAGDFPWGYLPLGTEGVDWDVLWKFPLPGVVGEVFATPAIGDVDNDGDLEVVIGAPNGNVYVLDGATGAQEHMFPFATNGGAIYASAALANLDDDAYLEIVIGSIDGTIFCSQWNGTAGSTEWTFYAGGPVYSSAAIADVDIDGSLEIVVGSTNGSVYSLSSSGGLEWNYATGGAVYSSPALADRGSVAAYDADWPMFRHDIRRTGFYGAAPDTGLDVYVGSDDHYLYLISGTGGLLIDRFEVYGAYSYYIGSDCGIHTSPSVADVDGDNLFDIFFYDWGKGSAHNGHTFWALEDTACTAPPITATIDIDPDTLNLKSNGEWITAYIELPTGYDVANIDVGSIVLTVEGTDFYVDPAAPTAIGDYDIDGISDLMVKFDRAAIRDSLIEVDLDSEEGRFYDVDFDITGTLDTTTFLGTDTVRVRLP